MATRTLITMIASVNNYERTCTRAPLKTRQKSTTSRPSTRSTLTPVATKNERRREKTIDIGVVVAYAVYSGGHVSAKWDEGEALNRVRDERAHPLAHAETTQTRNQKSANAR